MKKARFLVAMMLVVAALTVGVMAANEDYIKFETDTIECDGTNAITVNVVSPTGFSNGIVGFWIGFDTDQWDVATSNTKAAVNGNMISYLDDSGAAAVAANGTILTFTATPKTTNVASTFVLNEAQIVCLDPEAILADGTGTDTLTVEAAAQNTPATVSAPNMAWAEYTVGNTMYKGIWTGAYTVTAGTKKVDDITVAVNGAAAESLDVEAEAGATVDFKIAVIGKPELNADGIVVTAVEAQ